MTDENAFGLLIAYLNIEDDEYAGEREEFVAHHARFTSCLRARLAEQPPSSTARGIELGHALYVEVVDGEQDRDLISWLRETRSALAEHGYVTAGILTHGGSWRDDAEPRPSVDDVGPVRLVRASGPSEPLRRALLADAAARVDDAGDVAGWGAGLYLDVEAVEALGRKPKNQPTVLRCGGVEFFRAGA